MEASLTQMRQLIQYPANPRNSLQKARLSSAAHMLTAVAQEALSKNGPGRTCVELCLAAQAAAVALETHVEVSTRAGSLGLRLARFLGSVYEAVSCCGLTSAESSECNEVLRTANGVKVLLDASQKFPDADQVHLETCRASSSVLESAHMISVAHQLVVDAPPEGPRVLKFIMESFQKEDTRLRGLAIAIAQSVAACVAARKVADPTGGHESGLGSFGSADSLSSLISESEDGEQWEVFSTTELRAATAEMCHDLGGRPVPIREDGAPPAEAADETGPDSPQAAGNASTWGSADQASATGSTMTSSSSSSGSFADVFGADFGEAPPSRGASTDRGWDAGFGAFGGVVSKTTGS
mmetsp:Transcript_19363/g.73176  ORF Transcript_19363/g.73176 Transcript_19363/m.73176 type:complete len:353 (-) Transcript_19363:1417-2475(-)